MYDISGYRICEVISVDDESDGRRIKVRLTPEDNDVPDSELPYATPLLPKIFHIIPKVGESVYVINRNPQDATSERGYIGPIISQDNHIYYEPFELDSKTLFKGSRLSPEPGESLKPLTEGAYAKKEDVALKIIDIANNYDEESQDLIISQEFNS